MQKPAHTLAQAAHIPSDTVASLLSRQVEASAAVDQLHQSTGRYSSLIGQLEQAGLELDRSATAVTANPKSVDSIIQKQQLGQSTAAAGNLSPELNQLEHQLDRQQQLTATANELLSRLELAGALKKLLKKRHYQKLWAHYSQDIQTANPRELDYRVAHRAFAAGLGHKEIGLMLSAGSVHVCHIHNHNGKRPALHYVNQTVRNISQHQSASRKIVKQQSQLEL